jgi:hypothetical protein
MKLGSVLRTVGLWILILCSILSITLDFFFGNAQWGWAKVMIFILVIGHEIFRFATQGETISTKYKKFIQKNPVWGYGSLALFAAALIGLILHLAVW